MDDQPSSTSTSSSQAIPVVLTFCAISAFFIYQVYTEEFVYGSTAGNWFYPYVQSIQASPLWIPLAVLLLAGIFIFGASRWIKTHEKITLVGCFLIALGIQILIQRVYLYSLAETIQSDVSNSFLTPARNYSAAEILSQFQTLAASLPAHARTNMPGKILFYQFLMLFTSSPQWMGYLIIAFSTLGGVLFYGICRRLFHDQRAALYSFVLYTLIPCKQAFFPILNTVTPIFVLLSLYLFVSFLDSKEKWQLVLLGISLYLLALFEPSPFVTGIIFLGILFHAMAQKRVSNKDLRNILLIPPAAFLITYLLFVAFFSFNLLQTMQYVVADAVGFNYAANRSYSIWLRDNVKEFFYGAGLPVVMIFIFSVVEFFTRSKAALKKRIHLPIDDTILLCTGLTFLIVLLLGINRGETTRLWIYQAVFFQIPTAFFLARKTRNHALFFVLAGTLIAQSIITIQRVAFILP